MRLLSIQEAAEYLGLKVATLYAWVSQKKIPFVKCGRLVKFDLMRIDCWIDDMSVEKKEKRVKIA